MGRWNHRPVDTGNPNFKGEIATRLLTYADTIGITGPTASTILTEVRTWRETFISQGNPLINLAHQIHQLTDIHPIPLTNFDTLIDQYTSQYSQLLKQMVPVCKNISAALTQTQWDSLKAIYDNEVQNFPERRAV